MIKSKSLLAFSLPMLAICLIGVSCQQSYSPKPKAYPRIHFPDNSGNQLFTEPCPFEFEIPSYYSIKRNSDFVSESLEHPCWGYNLNLPDLNGTIYLTYKKLGPEQTLMKLTQDAHELTYKHVQKADYIEPIEIRTEDGTFGLVYYVGGDAASQVQFFVTDTLQHFLRGSLNFRTRPNADSLAPVVSFVSRDIQAMLETLAWKDEDAAQVMQPLEVSR